MEAAADTHGATPRGTVTVRARSSRTLGAAMGAAGVLGVVTVLVEGPDSILQFAAPSILFALIGWAAFWEPHVTVSDGGVTVANTLRTIEVPWPAIDAVEGRYGLRLLTPYGAVTAWAAGAPTGRERAREQASEVATLVEQRLAQLRGAGYLDDRRLERGALVTTWHVPLIGALIALALASVLLPVLA
jgi:hypothetical protein